MRTRGRGRGHRAAGRTPGLGQKQRPPPPRPCEGHVRTRPPARETAPCTDGPARDGRRLCGAVDTQFPPIVLSSPAGGAVSTEGGDPALPCPMAPAPVASLPGGSGPSSQPHVQQRMAADVLRGPEVGRPVCGQLCPPRLAGLLWRPREFPRFGQAQPVPVPVPEGPLLRPPTSGATPLGSSRGLAAPRPHPKLSGPLSCSMQGRSLSRKESVAH